MKQQFILTALVACLLAACEDPSLKQISGSDNGHDYVDLGLSVMWSPVNLGATTIGEFGDYYAWGETETKDYFSWENYKYCEGKGSNYNLYKYTKYGINPQEGIVDNLTTLEPEDDAAHVQWGGAWRMPTKEEWIELREKCSWNYSAVGKKGWTATGPNGNSIFFPLAGGKMWNENTSQNYYGFYRSATLGEKYSAYTYIVTFSCGDDDKAEISWSNGSRVGGISIRPICSPAKK